ncbi:hypothetical protein [Phormidium sp. CCY1219]|uniref:hypothetical protein n=1 Tax=Phormidium sp. CCY1219 TaxID=2886104 RepID=UPI002D1F3FAF|nr:hypothetical protein [Phormidium sp. CCY1219]MEB3830150.1 hypothetical protein [Phormidium sp. CCY1219]
MSMTSLLYQKDVKEKFRQEFPVPKLKVKSNPLAPALTKHYALVATAFDYLLRFYLEFRNPKANSRKWIAEVSLGLLRELKMLVSSIEEEELAPDKLTEVEGDRLLKVMPQTQHICKYLVKKGIARNREEFVNICTRLERQADFIMAKAKENYFLFLKTGELTDSLLKSCLFLAQLDPIYRVGKIDKNTGILNLKDMEDLKQLIALVDFDKFHAEEMMLLNPTFGRGSALVGGADADLAIDDMLVEVKTANKLALTSDYFHKLMFQYLLHRVAKIDGAPPNHEIHRLGIYFSRYGYLHTMNVADIVDERQLERFFNWFRKRVSAGEEEERAAG